MNEPIIAPANGSGHGNLTRIPRELRDRAQWCITPGTEAVKRPCTTDGELASTTNPATWCSFEQARAEAATRGWHVGYVLTADDPFACIDLDVKDETTQERMGRFQSIVNSLDSYSEYSRSGRGMHVWVRGKIGAGCKRDGIEVYSQERFIICTGNVYFDKPIADRQDMLANMVSQMRGSEYSTAPLADEPEREGDDAIIARASAAANGDKFKALWSGDRSCYESTSEADCALMGMIAFYSPNNAQCRRVFRMSGLGKREKVMKNDRYLDLTLRVIRGRDDRKRMIEHGRQIAAHLLEQFERKQGDWLIDVAHVISKPSRAPEFLTDQIMPAGQVTLLAAHGGAGKSLLMLMWAVHASLGLPFLGKGTTQAPIIFYSGEDDGDIVRFRLAKICEALDVDPQEVAKYLHAVDATDDPVLYTESGKQMTVTESYHRLKRLGDKVQARYFFIDNASDTFDGDEIRRVQVRGFIRNLKFLGKARGAGIVLAAHVDKQTASHSSSKDRQNYSGSSAWHNSVRSRLFLGEAGEDEPGLLLTHAKTNYGELAAPISLAWSEGGLLEAIDAEEAARIKETMDDIRLTELLRVIEALNEEGTNIPTATSGPKTAHHVLRAHPLFPKGMAAAQTNALLLHAERTKRIQMDEHKTADRKHRTRWILA